MDDNQLKELLETIDYYNPDAMLVDGLNEAIIGMGQQHGGPTVAIYDRDRCIELFAEQFIEVENDLTWDDAYQDAIEWFEYNVECAYVGDNTPIFMTVFNF